MLQAMVVFLVHFYCCYDKHFALFFPIKIEFTMLLGFNSILSVGKKTKKQKKNFKISVTYSLFQADLQ